VEKPCYDYKGLARSTEFLGELTSGLRAAGYTVVAAPTH